MGAIENDPNIILYEDFSNPPYDGSYDKSKWETCGADSGSTVIQNSGVLSMTHTSTASGYQGTSLCSSKYANVAINVPTYIEARLMIPSDHVGTIGITAEQKSSVNSLYTNCVYDHFRQSNNKYPTLLQCNYNTNILKTVNWSSGVKEITSGTWHRLRIEIHPDIRTLRYYLDEQQYDLPQPEIDFNQIKWLFSMWVMNNQSAEVIGYFDDVRIGVLEK